MPDITSTIRKLRKLTPQVKIYVCYDPHYDHKKEAYGYICRVQVRLDYDCRIWEKELHPRSDKAIIEIIERMHRKAVRVHVKGLKTEIKEAREGVKAVRSKATDEYGKVKRLREQLAQLKGGK
jgi:uncharacterized coiled-coil DUF342 family protein